MTIEAKVQCSHCNGAGVVLVNLRGIGFGDGFRRFMSAGCPVRREDDGSVRHEIVCPHCDGTGEEHR